MIFPVIRMSLPRFLAQAVCWSSFAMNCAALPEQPEAMGMMADGAVAAFVAETTERAPDMSRDFDEFLRARAWANLTSKPRSQLVNVSKQVNDKGPAKEAAPTDLDSHSDSELEAPSSLAPPTPPVTPKRTPPMPHLTRVSASWNPCPHCYTLTALLCICADEAIRDDMRREFALARARAAEDDEPDDNCTPLGKRSKRDLS